MSHWVLLDPTLAGHIILGVLTLINGVIALVTMLLGHQRLGRIEKGMNGRNGHAESR